MQCLRLDICGETKSNEDSSLVRSILKICLVSDDDTSENEFHACRVVTLIVLRGKRIRIGVLNSSK